MDEKITDFAEYTTPIDADVLAIVDTVGDATKKIKVSNLALNILSSTKLTFIKDSITNVTVDSSAKIVLAKWKIERNTPFTQTSTSDVGFQILYAYIHAFFHENTATNVSLIKIEKSDDDITYSSVFSGNNQTADTDAEISK